MMALLIMDKSTRVIATQLCDNVGFQWIVRQYFVYEHPKTVWARQNGMCAYCDVFTTPPDGDSVRMLFIIQVYAYVSW